MQNLLQSLAHFCGIVAFLAFVVCVTSGCCNCDTDARNGTDPARSKVFSLSCQVAPARVTRNTPFLFAQVKNITRFDQQFPYIGDYQTLLVVLRHDGKEVPRTSPGEKILHAATNFSYGCGGWTGSLGYKLIHPGETFTFKIELDSLFIITEPGIYTVEAKCGREGVMGIRGPLEASASFTKEK